MGILPCATEKYQTGVPWIICNIVFLFFYLSEWRTLFILIPLSCWQIIIWYIIIIYLWINVDDSKLSEALNIENVVIIIIHDDMYVINAIYYNDNNIKGEDNTVALLIKMYGIIGMFKSSNFRLLIIRMFLKKKWRWFNIVPRCRNALWDLIEFFICLRSD